MSELFSEIDGRIGCEKNRVSIERRFGVSGETLKRVVIRMRLFKSVTRLSILVAVQGLSQITGNIRPYLKEATIVQTAGTIHINANSPRPLAQVLDAMQQKYGWVVDYEDPQYVSPLDLLAAGGDDSRSRVPAGGSFSVEFPAAGLDEEKTLRLVVDSYNRSNNPGRFEVRQNTPDHFRVVGTAAHDDKGAISRQQIPFDLPITIASDERSVADTVNLICQEIGALSHTVVTVGVTPRRLLDRNIAKLGGSKVPAHELLLSSLRATNRTLYWRLNFDPNSKTYFLNIHSLRP